MAKFSLDPVNKVFHLILLRYEWFAWRLDKDRGRVCEPDSLIDSPLNAAHDHPA